MSAKQYRKAIVEQQLKIIGKINFTRCTRK